MGHSIQTFRGKTAIINDFDLFVLIGFSLEILPTLRQCPSLEGVSREWEQALRQYGPGVLDLKLDELLRTADQRREFGALLEDVKERIGEYKSKIPGSVLNEKIRIPGVVFYDYDVSLPINALEKLKVLTAEM
jgi:hypothetical protein